MYEPTPPPRAARSSVIIARVMSGLVLTAWIVLLTFASSPAFFRLFLPLLIPPLVCAGYLAVPGWHERKPGLTLTAIIVAALGLVSLPILFMIALLSHLGPVR